MIKNLFIFLPIFLLASNTHAKTKYVVINTVPNTQGGKFFDQQLGVNFTLSIMPMISKIIFKVFKERANERRDVPVLTVYISEFDGYAYKNGNNVNISASALDKFYFPRERSKFFFTSVLVHEMTHVYQWHGNFGAPGGLTEGTADYVMVKSGYYEKEKYTKPGEGNRWDQGYGVTERFLEYCDGLSKDFTVKLNKKMRDVYSDKYWVELLGKPVEELWREYKAKYGNHMLEEEGKEYYNGVDSTKYVVKNTVPNTPGGRLFDKEIGANYTEGIMGPINTFIFRTFEEDRPSLRRDVPVLTVYISEFDGYAYKNGDNVNISASALDKFYHPRNLSRYYFTMMLTHEMTHVFQWHGNFTAPGRGA